MKSYVVLLIIASTAQAQEFRETAVPNVQIGAVVRDVAQWHDLKHPDCRFVKAIGSEAVKKDADGTVEHWTIEACSGKQFTYEVAAFPSPDGGITDMVGDIEGAKPSNFAPPPLDRAECAEKQLRFDRLGATKDPNADYSEMAELAADLAACKADSAAP